MVKRILLALNARDWTDHRKGRLVALYPVDDGKDRVSGSIMWLCKCDCGKNSIVSSNNLRQGTTFSCGCQKSEKMRVNRKSITHEMSYTAEWNAWSAMKSRCKCKKNRQYNDWGGRGIIVCPEWENDFEAFFAYVGPRPSKRHSVDRYPNNDGNYEPGNVRWATREEQMGNKRDNVIVTALGITDRLINMIPGGSKTKHYERAYRRIQRGGDPDIAVMAALLGR